LLDDALREVRQLTTQGIPPTLGYFGMTGETPRAVADACIRSLQAMALESSQGVLSLRASALAYDADLIAEILHIAHATSQPVQFDSQGPDSAASVWAALRGHSGSARWMGLTLPGRWMRSRGDADRACELGLRVRVVKGQWADPLSPQFDERAGMLAVVSRLAGKAAHVSVATHDAPLAYAALKRLRDSHTPCELELIHGLPQQAALHIARTLGVPVRNYLAYGPGCAHARAGTSGRNPRTMWWALRDNATSPAAGA
jgi:proline dehydrogenase